VRLARQFPLDPDAPPGDCGAVNYRHAFHAGNFADLVKHAAQTRLLARLVAEPGPLTVIDTHGGAGLYDLTDEAQTRSREAEAGVARLQGADLPPEFAGLAEALAELNGKGPVLRYPGSPLLTARALREGDQLFACELRPDDFARLKALLAKAGGKAVNGDGFAFAAEQARRTDGRLMVLIDPPFERPDDYVRIVEAIEAVLSARSDAVMLIWLPIKDLETLDAFVRRLEPSIRPRPWWPRRGCGPCQSDEDERLRHGRGQSARGYGGELQAICAFVVKALGGPGRHGAPVERGRRLKRFAGRIRPCYVALQQLFRSRELPSGRAPRSRPMALHAQFAPTQEIDPERALRFGVGAAAAPLWGAFYAAASAGAAFWWMTAWTRRSLEAAVSPAADRR